MSGGRHGHAVFLSGSVLRKHLLASLIVCVALLTQFGASLWGAEMARDGMAVCHTSVASASPAAVAPSGDPDVEAPAQSPAKPDHACCSLCELSFGLLQSKAPVFESRAVAYRRVLLAEPTEPAPLTVFNRSAPVRAPPSQA